MWKDAGPRWSVKDVRVDKVDNGSARVTVTADLPAVSAAYTMQYTIYATGDVVVWCYYRPGSEALAMMPRFGTELLVSPGLENIAWYGRGPNETMIDRQFERIGEY
ncbi:MAG: hypothetical protein ACRD9L_19705, partial [Bryobacteraceae bacterium]